MENHQEIVMPKKLKSKLQILDSLEQGSLHYYDICARNERWKLIKESCIYIMLTMPNEKLDKEENLETSREIATRTNVKYHLL